jgi:hypothetical protein
VHDILDADFDRRIARKLHDRRNEPGVRDARFRDSRLAIQHVG